MITPEHTIKFLVLDVDGTLTDGGIYINEEGVQFKKFNAKDGLAIKRMTDAGMHVGFISGSSSKRAITERAELLGVQYLYIGEHDKLMILNDWIKELGIELKNVAFVGDDVNDRTIIKEVGFSACPADAAKQILPSVDVVLKSKGGEGCIREFIEDYIDIVI